LAQSPFFVSELNCQHSRPAASLAIRAAGVALSLTVRQLADD
jgi:hypothetical protein